jgi:hypothetical protein
MQLKSVATTIIIRRSVATTTTTTNTNRHRSRTERVRFKKRLSSSLPHILQDHHRSEKTSNHHRSTKTSGHHRHSNEKTHHQHQDRIKPPDLRRTTTPAGKQQLSTENSETQPKSEPNKAHIRNKYIAPIRRGNNKRRSRSLAVKMMKE